MADTMPQQLLLKKVRDVQYDAVETCDTATSTPKRPGHLINNFKARTELRIMTVPTCQALERDNQRATQPDFEHSQRHYTWYSQVVDYGECTGQSGSDANSAGSPVSDYSFFPETPASLSERSTRRAFHHLKLDCSATGIPPISFAKDNQDSCNARRGTVVRRSYVEQSTSLLRNHDNSAFPPLQESSLMIDRADNRERSLPQRHVGNTWSQHDLKWQGEIEQSGSDAWLLEDHLQELDIRLQSLEDLQLSLSGDMYDRAVMTRKSPLPCQPFIKKRSFIHERAEELPLTPSSPRKRGRAVRTSSAPSGPLEKLRKISSVGDREFIADNDMISPIDDSTAMFDAPPASRQRSFAAELKRISKIATVELEVTWSAPDFKTCRQIGGTYSSLKIASGRYETGDPSPPSTMVPDDGDDDYMQDVEISEVDSLSPDEDKMLLTIDPEAWAEEVEFLTRRGL